MSNLISELELIVDNVNSGSINIELFENDSGKFEYTSFIDTCKVTVKCDLSVEAVTDRIARLKRAMRPTACHTKSYNEMMRISKDDPFKVKRSRKTIC